MNRRCSWRHGVATVVAAVLAAVLSTEPARAEPVVLTIVHVNDLDRLDGSGDRGGVARLATVVGEVRASASHVLVTHGGDAISPSLLSSFDRGAHMIDLFNQVGFDAMVLGNHEFDFTPAVTVERIAEAGFPILSSNAVEPDGTLVDGVTENILVEVGPYKVGLFGLTTALTPMISSSDPVTFHPATEIATEQARKLRDAGADLVVALAHTGRDEDAALMRQGVVDLLLSGHDHDMKVEFGDGAAFVESGAQAEFVTIVEVAMDMAEGRGGPRFAWEPSVRVVNTASVAPDPRLQASVDAYLGGTGAGARRRDRLHRGRARQPAERGPKPRERHRQPDHRRDAGGDRRRHRADQRRRHPRRQDLPAGHDPAPPRHPVGAALRQQDDPAGGDRRRPACGAGERGQRCRGGRGPVSPRVRHGVPLRRLQAARKPRRRSDGGRRPARASRTYRLATNDFLGRGGDGYDMFSGAPRLIDAAAGKLMAAQVIDAIAAAGEIAPRIEGRIVRLD